MAPDSMSRLGNSPDAVAMLRHVRAYVFRFCVMFSAAALARGLWMTYVSRDAASHMGPLAIGVMAVAFGTAALGAYGCMSVAHRAAMLCLQYGLAYDGKDGHAYELLARLTPAALVVMLFWMMSAVSQSPLTLAFPAVAVALACLTVAQFRDAANRMNVKAKNAPRPADAGKHKKEGTGNA